MNKLKELRINKGLTQQQLSSNSGISISAIQKLESGVNDIKRARVDIILRLSEALGVKIEELII